MSTTRVQVKMQRGKDGRLKQPIWVIDESGRKRRCDGLDIEGPCRLRMLGGKAGVALFTESDIQLIDDPDLTEGS